MGEKNGNGTTALAVVGDHQYAILKSEPKAVAEVLAENMGRDGVQGFALDRVAIPSGGGVAWAVPTLDGEKAATTLQGVIIHWQDVRVYFAGEFTGEKQPPACSSEDGVTGRGAPGGECDKCPLSQWGSTPKEGDKGQACKQVRRLFLLTADELLPMMVALPPTSLGAARKYFQRLASRAIPFFAVETALGLEKDKNATGIAYSKATLSVASHLSPEQVERFRELRAVFAPQLATIAPDAGDYKTDEDKPDDAPF